MVEQKTQNDPNNLEDTVRTLQEENAKLLQLLRSQGLLVDSFNTSDGKSNTSTNLLFQNSDVTSTTNTINTTNQVTQHQINNHGPIQQQNYSGQIVHGHQSNINPNFNTVIQTANQPFVQNNSNTLVQNNTNVIQPINLVNFNNVSLDSIQSFLATQSNLLYMPSGSSSTNSTNNVASAMGTTVNAPPPQPSSSPSPSSTATTTISNTFNSNLMETDHSHQVSIRPKTILTHSQQEMIPIPSKLKSEPYENLSRQVSSTTSNTETTNLLDNDLNHKQPRPILPKPLARAHSVQIFNPISLTETKPIISNVLTPSSLINNTTSASSTVSILSPSNSFDEHHSELSPQLASSKSFDGSMSSTNTLSSTMKKPNKPRPRNRKPTSTAASVTNTSINPTPIPIAPNFGRPLAPAPINVQRIVTSTSTKRSVTGKKRTSKPLVQFHSESALQQSSPPSADPFAESISGLLQNFDQELMASNFLPQPAVTTTNILSNESSDGNLIQSFDQIGLRQIVNTTMQQTETFTSINEFNERLEQETTMINTVGHEFSVDHEQITSLISEEEMHLVEMNFDENAFLKQFDLEEPTMKFATPPEQPMFTSLLSNRQHPSVSSESSNSSVPPPPHPVYPGSSLINNNVFTTVVPLAQHQQSSMPTLTKIHQFSSRCAPEEGVQLTARHIEPSQVATYESGKYQDILDELVTVTDQDVLSHAQATADTVTDQTVLSTDFTFDLMEATNEIIKATEIEAAEETASAFVDLQYFYPMEQEEEVIEKLAETEPEKHMQESTVTVENSSTDILAPIESPRSEVAMDITDLSSIIQIGQVDQSSPIKSSPDEVAPVIDYDALLPVPSPATLTSVPTPSPPTPPVEPPPVTPTTAAPTQVAIQSLSSPPFPKSVTASVTSDVSNRLEPSPAVNRPARIIFEPILSPDNPSSPVQAATNEIILDSGCLNSSLMEKSIPIDERQIEELLNEPATKQFEIIESQGQLSVFNDDVASNNRDQLIEETQQEPVVQTPQKVENESESEDEKVEEKKSVEQQKEQYSPIPSVKLKLNSIFAKEEPKVEKSPEAPSESIRAPIKIKIRTKLPLPPPPLVSAEPEPEVRQELPALPKLKIRKPIKKPKRRKTSPSIDEQLEREAKYSATTEYAGLTRFEQPLAQLYHQSNPSPHPQIPPTPGDTDDSTATANHNEDQCHSASPVVNEKKQNHNSPIMPNHNSMKKLVHLLHGDDEQMTKTTFITPPPDNDVSGQQQQPHTHDSKGPSHHHHQNSKKIKKQHSNPPVPKPRHSSSGKNHQESPLLLPTQPAGLHLDPYSQSYHQFNPASSPFFHFPFPNPYLNPHTTSPSPHFHPNTMKYHHPIHPYPTHQQAFNYHHLQQQPQHPQSYHNSNYMPSRDHHPFTR